MQALRFIAITRAIVIGMALTVVGCAGPKAYQRGMLAKPKMQLDPEANRIEQHVYEYREGSAGGYGAGGGGCGCN